MFSSLCYFICYISRGSRFCVRINSIVIQETALILMPHNSCLFHVGIVSVRKMLLLPGGEMKSYSFKAI